jgi:hypothetical protein
MQRRTLIKTVAGWLSFGRTQVRAQSSEFPGKHSQILGQLAATVLPESLDQADIDRIVKQFVRWVREYHPGAEMQTGYGFTRVRYKPGSPEQRYVMQLTDLASGALTESSLKARRAKIAEVLKATEIRDLGSVPDGSHVASDLMSFYFSSSEANDRAYAASVGRDQCRGLRNSGAEPSPLRTEAASDKI